MTGGFSTAHQPFHRFYRIEEAFARQLAPRWHKAAYRIFAFLEAQEDCSLEAGLVVEVLIVCFNLPAAVCKGQKGSESVTTNLPLSAFLSNPYFKGTLD